MKIAFFDFDGTLTKNDSITEFYKFVYKHDFVLNYYLRNLFHLILVKSNLINYSNLKMRRLKFLIKKYPLDILNKKSNEFYLFFFKKDLKIEGINKIKDLQTKGVEVVIVSASMDLLLIKWAREMNVKLITNELEIIKGEFTGRFINEKDCNFEEKVTRIKNIYNLNKYDEISAFGDSNGDYYMLQIADKPHMNLFKN